MRLTGNKDYIITDISLLIRYTGIKLLTQVLGGGVKERGLTPQIK